MSKGLPKTAIERREPVIQAAIEEKAYAEAIKAMGRKIALEGNIQGNEPEERISRLQAEIANDSSGIPPEFLRQGQFDDIFFVGLPDDPEREAIFRIHLSRRKRDAGRFELKTLVDATQGFSGAEIRQTVVGGLFRAFEADRELETADMAAAAKETYPLSRSRAREIALLTAWARRNANPASR